MSVTSSSGAVRSTAGFQIGPNDSSLAATATPIDASGNLTGPSIFASTIFSLMAAAGGRNSVNIQEIGVGSTVDTVATTIGTFTIPNSNHSATGFLFFRSALTAASHEYDSTRVGTYSFTITRHTGANAVGVLGAVSNAQIATVASGRTLTSAITFAAVGGAVGASNTLALQVTNTASTGGDTAETAAVVVWVNALVTGITLASATLP